MRPYRRSRDLSFSLAVGCMSHRSSPCTWSYANTRRDRTALALRVYGADAGREVPLAPVRPDPSDHTPLVPRESGRDAACPLLALASSLKGSNAKEACASLAFLFARAVRAASKAPVRSMSCMHRRFSLSVHFCMRACMRALGRGPVELKPRWLALLVAWYARVEGAT